MLRVLPALWAGEAVTFEGRHVRLAEAKLSPGHRSSVRRYRS